MCRPVRSWAASAASPRTCAAARDGLVLGRAGWLAAAVGRGWVPGWRSSFAATHGAGPAIGRFSVAHHITGAGAWAAALVMMALADVLTRLAVHVPARTPPDGHAPAPVPDRGWHRCLTSLPGPPRARL